jgi:hypothetical protein
MSIGESRIDELFEKLYGFKPKKMGKAYELLVAAAFKLLLANSQIKADQYVAGTYSKETYQIDAAIEGIKTFVEAKDYTEKEKKVGRPDVSKLAGSLLDLPFASGIVASATDFSRPAIKYAEATKINPSSKPIDLYHVRPSDEEDEEGRIRRVRVNISLLTIDRQNMKLEPAITKRGNEVLKQLYNVGDSVELRLEEIHRSDGSILITIWDLTSKLTRESTTMVDEGIWTPPEPAFIKIKDRLVEISDIKYFIPRKIVELQLIVETQGTAQLLIKSEDGTIDKLLTDLDLKRVKITEDGEVRVEPSLSVPQPIAPKKVP